MKLQRISVSNICIFCLIMLLVLILAVCYCAFLKLNVHAHFFSLFFIYSCAAPTFSFKWNKEVLNNDNRNNEKVIKREPLT